jgi:2,4-dienoyl-CoA reductase (NADPH2)
MSLLANEPFSIRHLPLRNRIVGAPHGRGILEDGLPLPEDADYWRRRAAGGAAMIIVGGTATAPESTWRRKLVTEAWREEAIAGMALRAEGIRAEGAIAATQIVHLGRETTGAEMWFAPVAPSAVRSPREPTRPRPLSDGEVDAVVEGFRVSTVNLAQAGFQVVELHAAHGYLLAQFMSAATNLRPDGRSVQDRLRIVARIVEEIRNAAPEMVVGIRLSTDGEGEAGFTLDRICELLPDVARLVDYVSLTVGVRMTYVRDMATMQPPLLAAIDRVRPLVDRPLLVSQAFRRSEAIEGALAAGADLVGVARALIADPDMPKKLLAGREAEVRPCVACNEDCRAFDPVLLCSVNPDLAPPGARRRPAAPLVVRRVQNGVGRSVALVGAGPAGLECATSIPRDHKVVLFENRDWIGGELAVASAAPNRSGWRALLDYYGASIDAAANIELRLGTTATKTDLGGFDHVVLAVGSEEVLPDLPGIERAVTSAALIMQGARALAGPVVLIVDDGFGWWPCASAAETALKAGATRVVIATPGASFIARLPPEGAVQLLGRLPGAPLEIRPLTMLESIDAGVATLRNVLSGDAAEIDANTVVVVGERRARDWSTLVPHGCAVQVVGDALVPRRVQHAISEGRAAAERVGRKSSPHSRARS